jgi:hypothetical protein
VMDWPSESLKLFSRFGMGVGGMVKVVVLVEASVRLSYASLGFVVE